MSAVLMRGAGGTTTIQVKGYSDRGSCREAHAKKDGDERAHARRDQGSRDLQARRGFGGPRGPMASRSHQGSGGSKAQHSRSGQKGQPRGKKFVVTSKAGLVQTQRLVLANGVVIGILVAERAS